MGRFQYAGHAQGDGAGPCIVAQEGRRVPAHNLGWLRVAAVAAGLNEGQGSFNPGLDGCAVTDGNGRSDGQSVGRGRVTEQDAVDRGMGVSTCVEEHAHKGFWLYDDLFVIALCHGVLKGL